jgi:hypothetical protein
MRGSRGAVNSLHAEARRTATTASNGNFNGNSNSISRGGAENDGGAENCNFNNKRPLGSWMERSGAREYAAPCGEEHLRDLRASA